MDIDKIKEVIEKAVSASLTEKERESALKDMEGILSESTARVDELSEALESKSKELAEKASVITEKDEKLEEVSSKIEDISKELEALKSENAENDGKVESLQAALEEREVQVTELTNSKESLEKEVAELSGKLADIEKEKALASRMEVIEEAKIARKGDAAETQKAKVKEMTEEEFASYVEEMKALRDEFLGDSSSDEDTKHKTSAGRLNFEGGAGDDSSKKYQELGQALADSMKKETEKE